MELIKRIGRIDKKYYYGLFLCPYCHKKVKKVIAIGLIAKSCNCKWRYLQKIGLKEHGDSQKRLYHIWKNTNQRCNNKKYPRYEDYGGRGIERCKEWDDYLVFKKWALENGYKENLTIDRIDNNKGYSPENCRWTTQKENNRNKRSNKLDIKKVLEIKDRYIPRKITMKYLAKEYNVTVSTINNVIKERIWI
jgi:hypothetical protein